MSVAALARTEAVAIGGDSLVLARIVVPEVHLAIWRRSLPPAFAALAAADRAALDDVDAELELAALDTMLPVILADAGHRAPADAVREIVSLAAMFAAIMAADRLRIRLEVVETDACRRFHADHVTARLLTTLAGPGTQWMRVGEEGPPEQLAAAEVAIFKGRRWAEEPAILHRSPPIAGSGTDRLLLVIDPLG
ncbi:DUF1826 domain-containing protein [Sphingomonas sp. CLY1604]|uniref:DUF1826 domain-containing protein n=1 Tax=Sphingomonas sp. CLY1604 TaxID=3457786 RepID=UPI003FD8B2FC